MSDPYASIAAPLSKADPYAAIAKAAPKPKAKPKDESLVRGVILGAEQVVDNLAKRFASTRVGKAIDEAGASMGMPTVAQTNAAHAEARANNTRTGWQTLGNMVGTLPASRLPGGMAVQGAAGGALLSDKDTAAGVGIDAGLGAVGSVVGGKIVSGIGAAARGATDKGLKALHAAGVPLTLGQIASKGKGFASRAIASTEEALTSVPFLGDMINNARDRGTQGFNIALGNRILSNIKETIPKGKEAGTDMVDYVGGRLSASYTALTPKLTGTFDANFAADLAKAKAVTNTIPAAKQKQFASIVYDVFGNRAQGPTISGQALKDAEAKLTGLIKKFSGSTDADQKIMGDALMEVRNGLRAMVLRSNPDHAAELQALNKGWAMTKQLRKATTAAGNATGIATPAQALAANRAAGYNDAFLRYAKETLPNRTPDSGTARRAATMVAGTVLAGGTGAATISPFLAAPAAASILYTKPGQKALNIAVFGNRPKAVAALATPLKNIARYAPAIAPSLLITRDK